MGSKWKEYPGYVTVLEASDRMGVPRTNLRRWLTEGKFPSIRLQDGPKARRRIAVSDIEIWLAHEGNPPMEAYSVPPRPEPASAYGKFGWVYWIGEPDADTPVKVGFAVEVERRLSSIQTGNWHDLAVLGCIPGVRKDEEDIREYLTFCGHLVRGEWFEREAALAALQDEKEAFNYFDAQERHTGHCGKG